MLKQIETSLLHLRQTKPLVLNLTNYVTMDIMANSLLSLGATPIMSVCNEELSELIQIAHCVNINIGTLDRDFISRCQHAAELAAHYQKPIILDPVGSGASQLRTQTAKQLLPYATIVRGNASEILSLSDQPFNTRGVDSVNTVTQAKQTAFELARHHHNTIVVSGAIDYVTNGQRETEIYHGTKLMTLITGMGCTLTAVIAAFKAVVEDAFEASVHATHYFGLCGELAARSCQQPGSFRTQFIDCLHTSDFSLFTQHHAVKEGESR